MLKQLKKIGRGFVGLLSNEMRTLYKNNLMVQDLKARYVKGCDSIVSLNDQRIEIQAQKRISLEEYDKVTAQLKTVVQELKAVDTANQASWSNFNVLKAKYDTLSARQASLNTAIEHYAAVIENLNKLITKTKSECEKLKAKYTEIEFNVKTYKSMKRINDVIATTTNELTEVNVDIEEMNDDLRSEIAKFNVRAEETENPVANELVMNQEDMKKFIDSL